MTFMTIVFYCECAVLSQERFHSSPNFREKNGSKKSCGSFFAEVFMTNQELEIRFTVLVKEERRITSEILELIQEVERRKLHLERGFASLFDWLTKGHGYSQPAAYRRIQAARLLKAVPEAHEKISSGEVNLTTLAQVQGALKREEKRTGQTITARVKSDLLTKIEGKSAQETEKLLVSIFPGEKKESLRPINASESNLQLILDADAVAALQRTKELLSHALPGASWSEIVSHLVKEFVKRKDQSTSAAVNHRVKKLAGFSCEYKDPATGRICGSRYQIEVDHVVPKAKGGSNHIGNLRALCRQHNLLEARRHLGSAVMGKYWKSG
jgi:hypothetical protein